VKRLLTTMMLIVMAIGLAQAEPRDRRKRHSPNYIIRRQQAYQVQGVPTGRLIIGRREIDIYRAPGGGHLMFEGDYMIGVTR
jgi:hypothetical protein